MIGCEKATDSGVRDSFANRWRLGARVAGLRKCREIPHDPSWRFDAFGVPTVVLFLGSARVNATKDFFPDENDQPQIGKAGRVVTPALAAVVPMGWRRTVDGWAHSSTWGA